MGDTHVNAFVGDARGKQAQDMGPAILRLNSMSMTDMLAGLDKLTDEERKQFRLAAFDGVPKEWAIDRVLPEAKRVGIDRIRYAFDVVTNKSLPKDIPADLYETGQFKEACLFLAQTVQGFTVPSRSVWITIIGGVCEDARLRDKSGKVVSQDTTSGQAGWDIGIKYGTSAFQSLPSMLTAKCKGVLLGRVGLNAHGEPGAVSVNGVNEQAIAFPPVLRPDTMDKFESVFTFFDRVMTPNAMLLFLSCLAGNGSEGTKLLLKLSTRMPGRTVVAFSKKGYTSVSEQRRPDDKCVEPGVRDTPYPLDPTPDNIRGGGSGNSSEYDRYFKNKEWYDLNVLPWQSERSPHAKLALNGQITKGADL